MSDKDTLVPPEIPHDDSPREPHELAVNDLPPLEAALLYAAKGFPVFPVHTVDSDGRCSCDKGNDCPHKQRGKHPRTSHGVKDATTDPDAIVSWWTRWSAANIGIACTGKFVLDIDPDKGGYESYQTFIKEHGVLPPTLKSKTGSGGEHHFYRLPAGMKATNQVDIRPGLDIRTDGGYVVAPPSRHYSGERYRWLDPLDTPIAEIPAPMMALLLRRGSSETVPRPPAMETPSEIDPPIVTGLADVGQLYDRCKFVEHCIDHSAVLKESAWFYFLRILTGFRGAENLAHKFSREYPGYSYGETQGKILHALKYGPPSCSKLREQFPDLCTGCPANARMPINLAYDDVIGTPSVPSSEHASEATPQSDVTAPPADAPKERPLLTFPTIASMLDTEPPPMDWFFKDCIPAGVVGSIFGTGGVGKSTFALQQCVALATGRRFGPFDPEKPRRVIYLAGEDPSMILHRRLYHISRAMGVADDPLLKANLGATSLIGEDRIFLQLERGGIPKPAPAFDWFYRSLQELGPVDLIVIDPMNRFHSVNENDNGAVSFFVALLEQLSQRFKCGVLVLHHEAKAQRGSPLALSSGRGASSLRDGVRYVLSVGPIDDKKAAKFGISPSEYLAAYTTKSNYGPLWKGEEYFRRDENGVLHHADLHREVARNHAEILAGIFEREKAALTRRQIVKEQSGARVRDQLKEAVPDFNLKRDLDVVIDLALAEGWLIEVHEARGTYGTRAKVIRVPSAEEVESGALDDNLLPF